MTGKVQAHTEAIDRSRCQGEITWLEKLVWRHRSGGKDFPITKTACFVRGPICEEEGSHTGRQLPDSGSRDTFRNMFGSLARFLAIVFRERPAKVKLEPVYRVTLDMARLRKAVPGPGGAAATDADVNNWLMRMGCSPTGNPSVWKAAESVVGRIPKAGVMSRQKLK